jgi:UDP-N-acetylglucosamine enolpyruvyl transferase
MKKVKKNIDRGYEHFEAKLQSLGAVVERIGV